MQFDLSGKRAIVTGASRGLGLPVAIAYVRAGARVLFTGSDERALANAVQQSGGAAGLAVPLTADLSQPGAAVRVFEAANQAFGGVDVLFNNAGIAVTQINPDIFDNPSKFFEFGMQEYRRFFEVNTFAALELANLVAPGMIERGWGRIFCNTTSLDTMLRKGFAPYGGSKSALEAMTACMAEDLQDTGVTANVLVPGGPADTRMIPDNAGLPRDKLLPADVLVAPALWLASNLSDGVTGCRFIAANWDEKADLETAINAARAPIAWKGYGSKAIIPD